MIDLVTHDDNVKRFCRRCRRSRTVRVAIDGAATRVICDGCGSDCERYEHGAVALDARSRPTAAPIIAPSVGRLGTVRGDGERAAQ